MEFKEYGEKSCPSVLLVDDMAHHFTEDSLTSPLLKDYHIIVPIQDDANISATQEADLVEHYVKQNESGTLYAICGTSDGWKLIKEILARPSIRSGKVIVENREDAFSHLIISMLKEFALEDRISKQNRGKLQ